MRGTDTAVNAPLTWGEWHGPGVLEVDAVTRTRHRQRMTRGQNGRPLLLRSLQ